MSHLTIPQFQQHKIQGKKITVVTAYDALFTRIVEQAGLEVILVGDSLGMVVQGKSNTLSVTMDEMLYHTRMVAHAAQRALVISDMPFLSYQVSVDEAVRRILRLKFALGLFDKPLHDRHLCGPQHAAADAQQCHVCFVQDVET